MKVKNADKVSMQYLERRLRAMAFDIAKHVAKERLEAYKAEYKVELAKLRGAVQKKLASFSVIDISWYIAERDVPREERQQPKAVFEKIAKIRNTLVNDTTKLEERLVKKHKVSPEHYSRRSQNANWTFIEGGSRHCGGWVPKEVAAEMTKVADAVAFSDSPDVAKLLADFAAKKF